MRLKHQTAETENNLALVYEQQATPSAMAREAFQKCKVYWSDGVLCRTSPRPAVSCSVLLLLQTGQRTAERGSRVPVLAAGLSTDQEALHCMYF